MRGNFPKSLSWVLEDEGGNDDDPNDSGGRTSRGITQREYNAWCRMQHSPTGDVWHAPQSSIEAIYQAQYWQPNCDFIPTGIDYLYFDMAVNMGPGRATKILQRALGVGIDGHFGVITMTAVQDVTKPVDMINEIEENKTGFYESLARDIPHDRGFLNGWLNRVARTKRNALSLLGAAPVVAAAKVTPESQVSVEPAVIRGGSLALTLHVDGTVKGTWK